MFGFGQPPPPPPPPPPTMLEEFMSMLPTPETMMMAGGVVLAILLVVAAYVCYMANKYYAIRARWNFDVDSYVQQPTPPFSSRFKVALLDALSPGSLPWRTEGIPLAERESSHVPGLRITSKLGDEKITGAKPVELKASMAPAPWPKSPSIVVGTIRMGFGHHRIAYAASSWALEQGATYFHDLLAIESPEAKMIHDTDQLYSKGSRWASELGGRVEKLWGSFTKGGDENALRSSWNIAEFLKPLLLSLPKDTPIIAAHSWVGSLAVACGFTNVINLVIDNYAQWFIVVPGALNLVQGPSNYHNLLRMGVPAHDLKLVGAWIPKDMVDNIKSDCKARMERAKAGKARRLLIPVGGAGAQRKFVTSLVAAMKANLEASKVQLFLNAGDHKHMIAGFKEALASIDVVPTIIDNIKDVHAFCDKLRAGNEPETPVTLFAFPDYFPAVATTDIVSRVTDVLTCKPSELAFYPVPKFMIRRVGDHEAYSALRASELGDGTLELREVSDALKYIELTSKPDLLVQMNECIIKNNEIGLYDGCKQAVQLALERSKK